MHRKFVFVVTVLLFAGFIHAAAPVGETIWLHSVEVSKYVGVDSGNNYLLNADRNSAEDASEQFIVEEVGDGSGNILLRAVVNNDYVQRASDVKRLRAIGTDPANADNQWEWIEEAGGIIRLRSVGNNNYVTPNNGGTLKANGSAADFQTEFTWGVVATADAGPRIADTLYSDFDVPVITINAVTDFGVDNTGATDASADIQTALDAAAAEWVGVVYLPAGEYLLQSTISVPNNVTLRGDWKRPTASDKAVAGTVLLIDHGAGTSGISGTEVPLDNEGQPVGIEVGASVGFILNGQAQLRDVSIYYPGQTLSNPSNPTLYPFTIDAKGGFATTRNVTLVNSYDGIYTASSLPTAISVYGSPIHLGVFTNDTLATPRFHNINFGPEYWSDSGLGSVSKANVITAMRAVGGMGFRLGSGGGGGNYLGIRLSGYDIGMQMFDAQSPRMFDFEITECRIGMDIEDVKSHGWVITKGLIDAEEKALQLHSTMNYMGFNTVTFRSDSQLIDHQAGTLTLQNCTFESWGSGYYAIDSDLTGSIPAELGVVGCDFVQAGNHIRLGSGVSRAVVCGNTPTGSALDVVDNSTAADQYIVIDKDSTHNFYNLDPVIPVEEFLKVHKQPPSVPAGTSHLFNVLDYGADGTGASDDTSEIQNALDAAGALATSSAGCVVFCPPGVYRIDGRLSVPSYVELRGPHDSMSSGSHGGVLCLFADKNQPNNPATIKLAADSGIRGLAIFRPEQTWDADTGDTTVHPYPPAVQSTDRNWAYYILLPNTYIGLDYTIGGGHRIEFVYGTSIGEVVQLGGNGELSQFVNYQIKTGAWRQMAKNDFPVFEASGFGDGHPRTVGKSGGVGDIGTGLVFEGDGQFRTLGHFINQSGGGTYIVNGSPTINMYVGGGEGGGISIRVNSDDSAAMDFEVVNNSYHMYKQHTLSNTSAGDRLQVINSKHFGGGDTTHILRGDGHIVVQQDYRGVAHNCDLQLEDNATGFIEGGYFDSNASTTIKALDNSLAKMVGTLYVKPSYDFPAEDENQICVVSVCPDDLNGISGTGGVFCSPPAAPIGLVSLSGIGSVSLDWLDNTELDLAGYNVYRSTTSGSGYTLLEAGIPDSDYVDISAANGIKYYYVVTATDTSSDVSGISNQDSALPPDLTDDDKIDLKDLAEVASRWLAAHDLDDLSVIAEYWLVD